MSDLDFSVVSNNDVTLLLSVLDADRAPVNGTPLAPLVLKWQWFITNGTITKTTAGGTMSVHTLNPLVLAIPILSSETVAAASGTYAHECVTVDAAGNAVTITNNDPRLSHGVGYLREQLTVQA